MNISLWMQWLLIKLVNHNATVVWEKICIHYKIIFDIQE